METRKVVINACFGGFGLSEKGRVAYAERKGVEVDEVYEYDIVRDDADLVAIVEEMGKQAFGAHSLLKVVEIPADVEWQIEEYDGAEHIAEQHRIWC